MEFIDYIFGDEFLLLAFVFFGGALVAAVGAAVADFIERKLGD